MLSFQPSLLANRPSLMMASPARVGLTVWTGEPHSGQKWRLELLPLVVVVSVSAQEFQAALVDAFEDACREEVTYRPWSRR